MIKSRRRLDDGLGRMVAAQWAGSGRSIAAGLVTVRRSVRRSSMLLARAVYRRLDGWGTFQITSLPIVRRVHERLFVMRSGDVVRVMSTLASAGVAAWVAGGWGTDALLGRQTRLHQDLDLVVDSQDGAERLINALAVLGYALWKDVPGGGPCPVSLC
jgi:hypothetical protein